VVAMTRSAYRATAALLFVLSLSAALVDASNRAPRRTLRSIRDVVLRGQQSAGNGDAPDLSPLRSVADRLVQDFQKKIADFLENLDFDELADDARNQVNDVLDSDDVNIADFDDSPLDDDFADDLAEDIIEIVYEQLDDSIPGFSDGDVGDSYTELIKEAILDKLDGDLLSDDFPSSLAMDVREKVLQSISDSAVSPDSGFSDNMKRAIMDRLSSSLSRVAGVDGDSLSNLAYGLATALQDEMFRRFSGGNPFSATFAQQTAAEIRRKIQSAFDDGELGSPLDADFANKIRASVLRKVSLDLLKSDPCDLLGTDVCEGLDSDALLEKVRPNIQDIIDKANSVIGDITVVDGLQVDELKDYAGTLAASIRLRVQDIVSNIQALEFGDFDFSGRDIFQPGFWDAFADDIKDEILKDVVNKVDFASGSAVIKDDFDGLINEIKSRIVIVVGGITELDLSSD